MASLDTVIYGDVTVLDLIIFAISVVIVVIVAKVVSLYLKRALSDRMERGELDKLIRGIQVAIILLGIWFALPSFNFDVGQLLVVGGTVGLIIAFASQKIASNLSSGIFILIERPIRIGDDIRINDISGTVEQIRVLSTIVKTYDGVYVRVPNEQIFTSDIINYVTNPARRIKYIMTIGYGENVDQMMHVIMTLFDEHPFVLAHPAPTIFVSALGESGVEITIYVWVPSRVWWSVKTNLPGQIKELFDREEIEIPSPQRIVRFTSSPTGSEIEGGS
ncbi:MAG: mechanosensitive ion channel family protein [Methanoregulaceae archaeon]|nr:mechanosensitive ion channel family protein [Methanoregulaceae archaeon]